MKNFIQRITQRARSTCFFALALTWTALITVCGVVLLVAPRPVVVVYLRLWATVVLWLLKTVVGITHEISGQKYFDSARHERRPLLILCGHQSAWETIIFHLLVADPCFFMKEELMRIPFYGWLARKVGMIPVRRKRDKKTLRHLVTVLFPRAVAAMQQHGQSVIFFPTGTRLEPNQQQIPNPLVFGLYEQAMHANAIANSASTSITVLGVSLTSGTCWPKRGPLKPGVIHVRTIVIPPGLSKSAFLNALTATINN